MSWSPAVDFDAGRVSVERSPAFDAPWLVFGPAEGHVLLLACFYEWAEAIRYAHHYAERSRA